MNQIKSIISKLMITVITCAICIVSGVPVHAEDIEYISEVKMAIAKSDSDTDKNAAITDLESNGYTVLKATSTDNYETSGEAVNINAGTGKVPVYLGYKTTTDSKEAITDISMVEMAESDDGTAAYSFTAYDEIVKKYKDNISYTLTSLKIAMGEFATNYDAGSPAAVWAYENLNRFYDPESDELSGMGDVFIEFGRQVAEGNEDADLNERMTNYLLKSNMNFVNALQSLIAVGCAEYETDSTWIERFSEMDPEDTYAGDGYDEAATAILEGWEGIYSAFNRYNEAGLTKDSSDDELNAFFDKEGAESSNGYSYSVDTFVFVRKALQAMDSYQYDGKAMYDYFMQADNGDKLDKQTVLPLVASLTDGQRAMVSQLGIRGLFSILDNTEETWNGVEASVQDVMNNFELDESGRVSIYTGVNFSLYDKNGIALTSDAMVRQSSTGESAFDSSNSADIYIYGMLFGAIGALGAGIIAYATYLKVQTLSVTLENRLTVCEKFFNSKYNEWLKIKDEIILDDDVAKAALESKVTSLESEWKTMQSHMSDITTETQSAISKARWIGYGFSIALAVISVGIGVYSAIQYYNYIDDYYHPTYTQIPGVMIDNLKLENTSGIVTDYYVYYKTVMYNNDGTDEPADTNGFTGKKWNAMFTTTDKNAGAPIVASTLCAQIGSSEKENYTSVSKFHQANAYNLNAHQYTDNANGIYLFYQDTDNPNLVTGSVFSAGTIGGVLAGTAGGVVIGALGMMFVQKKKKKEAEA